MIYTFVFLFLFFLKKSYCSNNQAHVHFLANSISVTNKDTDFGDHGSVLLGHQLLLIGYNMSLWDYKKVIISS